MANTRALSEKMHNHAGEITMGELQRRDREVFDGQETTARCAFCDWSFTGTAKAAREAAAFHRSREHTGENGSAKLTRFAVDKPCGECPWPNTCAKDGTCWKLEQEAQQQQQQQQQQEARAAARSQRDALAAMDNGEPQETGPVDDARPPAPSADGASTKRKGGRQTYWTRERVIDAIRLWAEHHDGQAPTSSAWAKKQGPEYPVTTNVQKAFGSWSAAITAAGVQPAERHSHGGGRTADADPDPDRGRTAAWTKDEILAAIRRWAAERGSPPVSGDWTKRVQGYPSSTTVAKHFGSWANAIEEAGFPRPVRGGTTSRGQQPPVVWRVKVPGTGLRYRTPEEAYVAADEIEADGDRVADDARHDGNEKKAEQAADQAHELAEKIRAAAAAAEGAALPEPDGHGAQGDPATGTALPYETASGSESVEPNPQPEREPPAPTRIDPHKWAVDLREQLQDDPFTLTVDEPLPEHGMRLMETLGVEVIVRGQPAAPKPSGAIAKRDEAPAPELVEAPEQDDRLAELLGPGARAILKGDENEDVLGATAYGILRASWDIGDLIALHRLVKAKLHERLAQLNEGMDELRNATLEALKEEA